jgi:uncharacterized protein (DUF305 family)
VPAARALAGQPASQLERLDMKTMTGAILVVFLLIGSAPSYAQQHDDHSGHSADKTASPATKAYEAANAKMHKDMVVKYTGNADADFVRGMIPHHQGAVDMAKVVLQHGKDPEVRKLAEDVIASQEKEIAWMKGWLAKNGK